MKIEVSIKQHVLKSDIEDIDSFKEVFEDPDPYFHYDDFGDEIEIQDLTEDSKIGKCSDEGETYARTIDYSISFKIKSVDKLKEFWEDEIIVDNMVEWGRFGYYWMAGINPVFLDFDEETGEQVWKPAEGGPEVSLDQWNEASTLDEEVMDQENIEPDSTSISEEEPLEEDSILEDSETSIAETEEELEESEESS